MEKNSKEDNLQKLLENFECKLAVENEVLKKKKGILWQLQEQNKKLQQELELLNEDLTSTSLNVQNLKSMLGKIDQKIKWNSKLLEKRTVFNEALEIDQKVLDKQKAALFEFKNVQEKAMKNWTQNISEHAALWEEEMFNHDSTSTSSNLSLQLTNMRKKIQDVDKEIAIAQKELEKCSNEKEQHIESSKCEDDDTNKSSGDDYVYQSFVVKKIMEAKWRNKTLLEELASIEKNII